MYIYHLRISLFLLTGNDYSSLLPKPWRTMLKTPGGGARRRPSPAPPEGLPMGMAKFPCHHYYSPSLASFKEANELCESLKFNIVRQHTKFASEMSCLPCLTASKHEKSRIPSCDEICSPAGLRTHDNNKHATHTGSFLYI